MCVREREISISSENTLSMMAEHERVRESRRVSSVCSLEAFQAMVEAASVRAQSSVGAVRCATVALLRCRWRCYCHYGRGYRQCRRRRDRRRCCCCCRQRTACICSSSELLRAATYTRLCSSLTNRSTRETLSRRFHCSSSSALSVVDHGVGGLVVVVATCGS